MLNHLSSLKCELLILFEFKTTVNKIANPRRELMKLMLAVISLDIQYRVHFVHKFRNKLAGSELEVNISFTTFFQKAITRFRSIFLAFLRNNKIHLTPLRMRSL